MRVRLSSEKEIRMLLLLGGKEKGRQRLTGVVDFPGSSSTERDIGGDHLDD